MNEAEFTSLYRRHQGAVFRFALHMSGRKEVAEEVTQEVFLTLIREPKQYRPERGPLEAFLIGIARKKVRRHLSDRRQAFSRLDDVADFLCASTGDPFEHCSKGGELRHLQAAILALPPRYREVLALCDLEEMPYSEVAGALECPVGTVRSRLHRARTILTAKLRKTEGCPA